MSQTVHSVGIPPFVNTKGDNLIAVMCFIFFFFFVKVYVLFIEILAFECNHVTIFFLFIKTCTAAVEI